MNATAGERRWKVAHDLLRRVGSIVPGLRRGCAGLQPSDHVEGPASRTLDQFRRGEAHGHPKLAAVQLARNQRKLEFAGHDADNLVRLAVKKNLLAENAGIAMQAAVPCLIAE